MQDISPGATATEFQSTWLSGQPELQNAMKSHIGAYPWLTAKDITDAVEYVVSAPAHVCVQELLIAPTEQSAV